MLISVGSQCQQMTYGEFKSATNPLFDQFDEGINYCTIAERFEAIYADTNVHYPDGYLTLALAKYHCGHALEGSKWLALSIQRQGFEFESFDRFFSAEMRQNVHWKEVIGHYDKHYSVFSKGVNSVLKFSIDSLFELDQAVRDKQDEFKSVEEFNHALHLQDTANMTALKALIAEHGMPDRYKIGNESSFSFIVMLFHYIHPDEDQNDWDKYTEMLLDNYMSKGGFVYGFWIMMFIDQAHYSSNRYGHQQWYGTLEDMDTKQILPIRDMTNVDARRLEMGAVLLDEYAKKNGFTLPEGYVPAN